MYPISSLSGSTDRIVALARKLTLHLFAILPILVPVCEARQTTVKPPTEIISAAPGQKIERQLKGAEKPAYEVELAQGQFISAHVNCHDVGITVGLDDPDGNRVAQFDGDTDGPDNNVEIAGEKAGKYRIFLLNTSPNPVSANCTIELGTLRAATEKELALQQASRADRAAWDEFRRGNLPAAEKSAKQALSLREKMLGADDPLIADSHMFLGILHLRNGNYPNAETELLHVLKIREARKDTRTVDMVTILGNLGNLYNRMGDFDKAAEYLQRTVALLETTPGSSERYLALALDNLANTYYMKGDYIKTAALYQRVLDIRQKSVTPENSDIGDTFNSLATLYQAMGDYASAEKFYQRSIEAYGKQLDPTRVAYPLMGLGTVYSNLSEFEKSEAVELRALEIFQKALGPDHPTVGSVYKDIAAVKTGEGDFVKAEEYYLKAAAILKGKLGEENPEVAEAYDSLGALYSRKADYAKAEPLLEKALAIREKTLGPEHPDVVGSLTNLSALQSAKGNFVSAESFLRRAISISEHNADLNLLTGSERQKLAYLDFLSDQLNQAVTLNVNFAPDLPAARKLAATAVLQRKGRVLDVLSDNLVELRKNFTKQDAALLKDFDKTTSQLSRLVLGGPQDTSLEDHQKQIAALQEKREMLESEISRHSAEYAATLKPVTLEAVRASLPENAALLEFASYDKFSLPGKSEKHSADESLHYVVFVIRSSGEIQSVDLGKSSSLDAAINLYRQALRDPDRDDVKAIARALSEKIISPLRASIGDATQLLVSADGQLNLIPFESLVDDQNRFLVERYSITYLTSGRDLLRMQIPRKSKSEPLIVANPDFGEPDAATPVRAKYVESSPANARRSITTGDDLSSVYFAPLTGTAEESRAIHTLFPQARVLSGRQATKESLKAENAPSILHIATHGFFLQDSRSNQTNASGSSNEPRSASSSAPTQNFKIENPLLRSGLALTGANQNRRGADDGILTALEASGLNLWGTKLVTLSACETGVGEVKNGEGVYGLRRSFFLAGTETLVMSLWSVSDRATRDMMTSYYTGLKQGLGRGQALRQAQLEMLKRKDRQHPYYWASFIQSGEWANLDGKR